MVWQLNAQGLCLVGGAFKTTCTNEFRHHRVHQNESSENKTWTQKGHYINWPEIHDGLVDFQGIYKGTRWAPTSYKWNYIYISYNPYQWPQIKMGFTGHTSGWIYPFKPLSQWCLIPSKRGHKPRKPWQIGPKYLVVPIPSSTASDFFWKGCVLIGWFNTGWGLCIYIGCFQK